ncbi:DUF4124 domain-containing protein [Lampropedia aestuarii]|nr:DUF4124 domain-containing protein [Lampropedia aestuarii]
MLKNGFRGVAAGVALMLVAGAALAQWQWVDESGKKVYSDRPPPITVPERNILKMPRGASMPHAGAHANRSAAVASGEADADEQPANQDDQDLKARAEAIQKQQEAQAQSQSAEIAQKNAEIDKANAATRKSNCERARGRLAQLEPGKRVMTTDADGNVGFMNEATRAAERQSVQETIRANCN